MRGAKRRAEKGHCYFANFSDVSNRIASLFFARRSLEVVTASGLPYFTLGAVSEVRMLIKVVWKVIKRREEEGERLKREWKGRKERKETISNS